MQTTPHDPTNQEILEAINTYSASIEKRLDRIEGRVDKIEGRVDSIEGQMAGMATKEDMTYQIGKLRSDMIDYLDNKFFDFRGDLVAINRKEDTKVKELIKILHSKNVLTEKEVNDILRLEPFPTSV